MEVNHSSPKRWASSKRSQRYSDPKEKRKAHPNGQKIRKVVYEKYYVKSSSEFTFDKSIRTQNRNHPSTKLFAKTPFEKELNLQMLSNKTYSLNKHKNWEKINKILDKVEADDQCKVLRGKKDGGKNGANEFETVKLAYFDMEQLENDTNKLLREQHKYEKSLNYDVCDINNYIKDKFYQTMQRKNERKNMRNWQELQCVKPKSTSKESHFIRMKCITASSVKAGCKAHNATIKSFGKRSFWSPIKQDDGRDFIQMDLGKNYFIEAISTRGRVLQRTKEYEIDYERSKIEYVKKYKVWIKKDDGKQSAKTTILRHGDKMTDDEYIALGVFDGNKDSETESVNKLKLSNNNKNGVVCRYIRVQPLNLSEGGYYGKKSMRVGVYGNDNCEQIKNKKDEQKSGVEKTNGELIRNRNVPAAIITITRPSDTHHRNCWAVNHRNDGVISCSCWNCSDRGRVRLGRRGLRNDFKKQVKGLKHVNDYDLDKDAIFYQAYRKISLW